MTDPDTLTEGMVIRPGDTFIVRIARSLTYKHADEVKTHLEDRLPGVTVLVIVADGMAVYRPDELLDGAP